MSLIFLLDLVKKYLVGMINLEPDGKFVGYLLGGYVKFFGDRNVFSQADQEKIINKYST